MQSFHITPNQTRKKAAARANKKIASLTHEINARGRACVKKNGGEGGKVRGGVTCGTN